MYLNDMNIIHGLLLCFVVSHWTVFVSLILFIHFHSISVSPYLFYDSPEIRVYGWSSYEFRSLGQTNHTLTLHDMTYYKQINTLEQLLNMLNYL